MAPAQAYPYPTPSHQLSFVRPYRHPSPHSGFCRVLKSSPASCLSLSTLSLGLTSCAPTQCQPSSPSSRKTVLISLTDPPAPQAAATALFVPQLLPGCNWALSTQPKSPLKVGGFQDCSSRYPASAGCTDVSKFLKDGCSQFT